MSPRLLDRTCLYSADVDQGGIGTYSEVHCDLTRRSVIEDLPHPPSPQIVIDILSAMLTTRVEIGAGLALKGLED